MWPCWSDRRLGSTCQPPPERRLRRAESAPNPSSLARSCLVLQHATGGRVEDDPVGIALVEVEHRVQ